MSTVNPTVGPAVRVIRRPAVGAVARPPGRSVPRSARGSVRLTRRGRLVVLMLALAVAAVVAMTLAAGSAATGETGGSGAVEVVTVVPGDTLWGIASDVAEQTGGGDVREVMARIQQLNTLDSSVVYAGQQLRVPTH